MSGVQGDERKERALCREKRIGPVKRELFPARGKDHEMFPAFCTGAVPAVLVEGLWHIENNRILVMAIRASKTDHVPGSRPNH